MSSDIYNLLSEPGSVLLPGGTLWSDDRGALVLHSPSQILRADSPEHIPALLNDVQAATEAGCFAAGYLAYEAGGAFELSTHEADKEMPLAWFAVYSPSNVLAAPHLELRSPIPEASDFRLNVSQEEYQAAVLRVKDLIAAGDTYQVNYTCRARFSMEVDPLGYFCALVGSHPVPYAAYVYTGDEQILSLSPELFLKRRGESIETRPMKGTRRRGRTIEEDAALARELVTSEKDRAENVMILDMMRNDLGRFCKTGSIRVPEMFTAEKYRSVWQMTSSVTGIVPDGVSLAEIMAATFPGSSITGAPKRRTMEIIRELENEPRGMYTGAICLFMPGGDFTCNIAIRTLVHNSGSFELGIGSGIVWDSDPEDEYQETLLKSQFAFSPNHDFSLFETLLLDEDRRYAFESEHIERIAGSAAYWDFPFDRESFAQALSDFAGSASEAPLRVHAEVDQNGEIAVTAVPLPKPPAGPVQVMISAERTNSHNRLLYHKTTERATYSKSLAQAQGLGCYEAVFTNEQGHLTEGSFTNLFVLIDVAWITPPIDDGMLPGIWRESFIKKMDAVERSLALSDLAEAEEIIIGNSVRGVIAVGEIIDEETSRVLWKKPSK